MKSVFLFILVLSSISCCKTNSVIDFKATTYGPEKNRLVFPDTINKEALALNDSAVKILQSYLEIKDVGLRDSILNNAINGLNIVIQADSTFYFAYLNKASILRKQNKYEESIKVLEELIKIQPHPEALLILGITYEKLGLSSHAEEIYKEAREEYDKYLNSPVAIAQDEINRLLLEILIEGKEKALVQTKEKLKKEPHNKELRSNKQILMDFDRQKFISSF